ncbi:Glu-tRNA(Gln) amidotransferase subunit GatD [Thermofilum pendens]|uniref:Glutamyl-tRNA(Gln) amidotransferase subunit D n=1 Tax=Thermofilum pendens (strain DSM 2475 / Hrk 5) TaxID=368408 RepID=GATD_THEPD|nr:Glu-tRNA(Gln) amidotransferase subunit GatD [Thermofilum pendens]A1RX40.1 RecName: Full=Glutamyl-tRNA(Gln) amidotransferase subunit D; Short=Glu-ADT subunit D [Thermofilum pendens Hrk 5]ABL77770.1 glutamyl-tRNA(Gln) amidotransferase subunit D [Thermofilum pendens Hrk 5]
MSQGYSEKVKELLDSVGAAFFDRVKIKLADGLVLEGLLMPRPAFGDPDVVVLKLDNGYNIGISLQRIVSVELLEKFSPREAPTPGEEEGSQEDFGQPEPRVFFVGTGGTIASRVDYVTGAVYPYFTAEELYSMIPELKRLARISSETLFSIFSEDMTPSHWQQLASKIGEIFRRESDVKGVVVAHGTDTLHYSAAAMAFAVQEAPGPIVFVGAQRSSDRPSSDAALNVIGATVVAVHAPFAESVIAMHGSVNDDTILVHRGVRARKMHTSRRDAFMSINSKPIAEVDPLRGSLKLSTSTYKGRGDDVVVQASFSDKVALVKFYPGMSPDIFDFYLEKGFKGLVIEGTGLGHVSTALIDSVRRLVREGVFVAMASQCIFGRVNMNVYRTGVELIKAGVVPAGDMIPETAYVKLSWILGQTEDPEEIQRLFTANLAFEISERSEFDHYPGARW